jgi:DNA repair photolyase
MPPVGAPPGFRWTLTDDDGGQPPLSPAGGDVAVVEIVPGRGELRGLEFLHVRAKRLINAVPTASRMPFRFTINPYRGCSHACVYCFARPTHEYLGLGAGRDFERRIVVKVNAVERLRAELASRRWGGDPIAMGTNTDPYQLCEGRYRLTRGIAETLMEARNPFSILTKSTLVLRDLDVLGEAARRTDVRVDLSVGCLDTDVWRATEPGTPNPLRRIDAVARLREAGIPSGVLIAPILPGLSDGKDQIEAVVKAAAEAGADFVSPIMLHLRPGVREHYLGWLEEARGDLTDVYARRYRRAYLSRAEQHSLGTLVRRLWDVHGRGTRHSPARGDRMVPAGSEEVNPQLSLL